MNIIKNKWIKSISLLFGLIVFLLVLNVIYPVPEPFPNGTGVRVVSAQGDLLRNFPNANGVFQNRIELNEVSDFYIQSLLNYEDRWFFYHIGFNPFSLFRAAFQWVQSGQIISGGSTITMQVARLIEPQRRTILGKLKQILRALQLELKYSKKEILTLYINLAPFGGNVIGVEAAANKFFSKSAVALNMNEATTLVVLPQKPSAYRPDRHPELALKMRNKVLARSLQAKLITPHQYAMLEREALNVDFKTHDVLAPLLSRRLLTQDPDSRYIETTIDTALQEGIQTILHRKAVQLPQKTSVAVLVLRNEDAAVIGYRGSVDFSDNTRFSYVDMVQARRSPGSTLKPFIYGMALDNGYIHSESLLSDIPTSFSGYKPSNLSGKFHGAMSVREALTLSLNVPVVQLLYKLGADTFHDKLVSTGMVLINDDARLSIALGGAGTNLWSLAMLYRSLVNQGEVQAPYVLKNQQHSTNRPTTSLLSKESSWIVFNILSSISAPDRVIPSSRREIAWKTGTSYGYRDFWSVGVSKDYTVAVWVGRPDATPIVGYLGSTQASPIMFDVFDLLPRDRTKMKQPASVEQIEICWPGGLQKKYTRADKCQTSRMAYSIDGKAPPTMDSFGNFIIDGEIPTPLAFWMQSHHKFFGEFENVPIKIVNLKSGQHFFKQQGIRDIELMTNKPDDNVNWYINDQYQVQGVLSLGSLQGKTKVSVCQELNCDSVTIYVH